MASVHLPSLENNIMYITGSDACLYPHGTTGGGRVEAGHRGKCMQRLCGCVFPWRHYSEKVSRWGCFHSFRDLFL